jgi:hypothetical protein
MLSYPINTHEQATLQVDRGVIALDAEKGRLNHPAGE